MTRRGRRPYLWRGYRDLGRPGPTRGCASAFFFIIIIIFPGPKQNGRRPPTVSWKKRVCLHVWCAIEKYKHCRGSAARGKVFPPADFLARYRAISSVLRRPPVARHCQSFVFRVFERKRLGLWRLYIFLIMPTERWRRRDFAYRGRKWFELDYIGFLQFLYLCLLPSTLITNVTFFVNTRINKINI